MPAASVPSVLRPSRPRHLAYPQASAAAWTRRLPKCGLSQGFLLCHHPPVPETFAKYNKHELLKEKQIVCLDSQQWQFLQRLRNVSSLCLYCLTTGGSKPSSHGTDPWPGREWRGPTALSASYGICHNGLPHPGSCLCPSAAHRPPAPVGVGGHCMPGPSSVCEALVAIVLLKEQLTHFKHWFSFSSLLLSHLDNGVSFKSQLGIVSWYLRYFI